MIKSSRSSGNLTQIDRPNTPPDANESIMPYITGRELISGSYLVGRGSQTYNLPDSYDHDDLWW